MRFPLKRRPVPPAAAQAVQTAPAPGLFWEGQGLMGLEHQCQLYDRLRQVRAKLSAAQNVPVYVIFSNATLDAMAAYRPTTPAQLLEVPGVGQAKLQKYGMAFLKEIQDWARERAGQAGG